MTATRSLAVAVNQWLNQRASETSTGCWQWVGSRTRNGYGQVNLGGRRLMAHRAIYEFLRVEIPAGLDLDHLCRNRACVNPWHLEPVTRSENLRRGDMNRKAEVTHCLRGHAFDEGNTRLHAGRRYCRACCRQRARGYSRISKEAAA